MNKERQLVLDRSVPLPMEHLDGMNLDGAAAMFLMLSYQYEEWCSNEGDGVEARINLNSATGKYFLDLYRQETEKEYSNRLAKEERTAKEINFWKKKKAAADKKHQEQKEAKERAEYKRLHSLYGDC